MNEKNRVFSGDKLNNLINNITLFSEDKDVFKRVILTTKEAKNNEITLVKRNTSVKSGSVNKDRLNYNTKVDVFKKANDSEHLKEM